jgi:hypothetical protein
MGNLAAIMCVTAITHATTEAIVKYEDGTVFVAVERSCGCISLRPVTIADLKRLPLLEGEPDSDSGGGEGEIAVPEPLPLAA